MTTYQNLDYSNTFVVDMTNLATKINIDKKNLKKQITKSIVTIV